MRQREEPDKRKYERVKGLHGSPKIKKRGFAESRQEPYETKNSKRGLLRAGTGREGK